MPSTIMDKTNWVPHYIDNKQCNFQNKKKLVNKQIHINMQRINKKSLKLQNHKSYQPSPQQILKEVRNENVKQTAGKFMIT